MPPMVSIRHGQPLRSVRVATAALLLVLGSGIVASAQGPVRRAIPSIHPETSSAAETLLKTADAHARQGEWDSAVELYQRAIRQYPDALTALGPDIEQGGPPVATDLYVNVGEYAQRRIAALPVEALRVYRDRIDGEAGHLFRIGSESLDPEPLRRIVETLFCSTWGDDAAELLADLSFQDGRFDEALTLYRRLAPADGTPQPPGSTYPDPDVDLARVAAKALLCRAAMADTPEPSDLERFEASYPEARGRLAGRDDAYAEIVRKALIEDGLRHADAQDERWSTFAGSPARTKLVPDPIDPGTLVWSIPLRTPLDPSSNINAVPPRFGLGPTVEDGPPPFFPVLLGDELLLTDGREVLGYPLDGGIDDGRTAPEPSWRVSFGDGAPTAARPTFGIERHTITVHGDLIFARLGPLGIEVRGRNAASAPSTSVVAIDRRSAGAIRWRRTPEQVMGVPPDAFGGPGMGTQLAFGGAPLADDHGVYITLLKPGAQSLTWAACLEPRTGATRWLRFVCAGTTRTFAREDGFRNQGLIFNPDLGHRLLTLGGSTLYYQTDLGALAAIDARSGRLKWLATYPRDLGTPGGTPGDAGHNPAMIAGDLVIVAPEDSDLVLAFRRSSGTLAWAAEPGGRVAHLLGVGEGNVVATGDSVWTIDAANGALRSRWPEGRSVEQGHGRGLLAGGEIYWPTRDRLYILDQGTGLPVERPPIMLRERFGCGGGNLVAGDGYLAIAERERLLVFCKDSRMLRYYQDRLAATPDDAGLLYRLARLAETLDMDALALESLDRALEAARPSDRIDGVPLVEAVRSRRFAIRLTQGRQLRESGDTEGAVEAFRLAADDPTGRVGFFEARLEIADAWAEAGAPGRAVDELQALLERPEAARIDLRADEQRSVSADRLIVERMAALIALGGRELYGRHDDAAEALLELGIAEGDPRPLEEVVRSYPMAEAVPTALVELGELQEERGDWPSASRTYHRLVTASIDAPEQRRIGLLGLARAFEAMGLGDDASEARALAVALGSDTAGSPESDGAAGGASMPGPPLRLAARDAWPPRYQPIPLEGGATELQGLVMLIGEGGLSGYDPSTGALSWNADLNGRPSWFGVAGGRLIAAFDDRIEGFDPSDDAPSWRFDPFDDRPIDGAPAVGVGIAGLRNSADRLHGFRVRADRLYCLRGARDLFCIDPVAGRLLWSYRGPGASIDPHYGLGLARVVLQLREPNAIGVLDALDGRTLGHFPQGESVSPWRREPFPISPDRVALVPDSRTIQVFDHAEGRVVWESRAASPLPESPRPTSRDPLVFGDHGRLLAARGAELRRHDPTDGRPLWTARIGEVGRAEGSPPILLGPDACYAIGAGGAGLEVAAISMETGKRLWTRTLSGDRNERWGLALSDRCVLAYRLDDGTSGGGPDDPLILTILRRDDGRRVQRLVVPMLGEDRRVALERSGMSVAGTSGRWLLAGLDAPTTPPEAAP